MSTESLQNKIRIQCGANSQDVSLNDGETLTVGDIRRSLGDIMNIGPTTLAITGGEQVDDDRVVLAGSTVEFVKQSGSKG